MDGWSACELTVRGDRHSADRLFDSSSLTSKFDLFVCARHSSKKTKADRSVHRACSDVSSLLVCRLEIGEVPQHGLYTSTCP